MWNGLQNSFSLEHDKVDMNTKDKSDKPLIFLVAHD